MEGKLLNYNVAWVSFSSDDLKNIVHNPYRPL